MAIKAPIITTDAKPYWDALSDGKLLIQECKSCSNRYHYPRPFCPDCMSRDVGWLETSGNGTIHSFTIVWRRGEITAAPVFVELDEGPTLLSALVDYDHEKLAIGQRVKVKLVPSDGGPPIPFFTPA